MGALSIWHWILLPIIFLAYFLPTFKIVKKAGYSGWWCLLMLVPIVQIVMLWVFACSRWPALSTVERKG